MPVKTYGLIDESPAILFFNICSEVRTCFAPICLAFSLIPMSLNSLRANNTRFALLFAYS